MVQIGRKPILVDKVDAEKVKQQAAKYEVGKSAR
jgi:hypothetical protein